MTIDILEGAIFLAGTVFGAISAWLFGRRRWPQNDRNSLHKKLQRKEAQLVKYECCLRDHDSKEGLL